MTDQERARFFLAGLDRAHALGLARYLDATDSLAADYAEVRRLERKAIVAWLRSGSLIGYPPKPDWAALDDAADRIERGEHVS